MRAAMLGAVVAGTAVAVAAFGQGGEHAGLPPARQVELPHCSSLTYGGEGRPDVLIAASTSLQGRAAEYGVQGVQAMKLALG